MRRHKPIASTVQLNLRVTPQVFGELEARSKAQGITVSELVRRAIDSLNPKPKPSLAEFRADWLDWLRDAIEAGAREEGVDIVKGSDCYRKVETVLSRAYGDVETALTSQVHNFRVRQLLRGVPVLPDETKSKPKPTQH
jgi:hypothetical protein